MAHVVTELDSTASPERVLRALTDFSPRRFDLWPNVDRKYYQVDEVDETSAEVVEGSDFLGASVWEKGHYDWSRPGSVHIDVEDSNTFQPGSYWDYQVTPRPGGGSHVHMEFDRRPRNFKGQVLSFLLGIAGKQIFKKSLSETLRRVEASAA